MCSWHFIIFFLLIYRRSSAGLLANRGQHKCAVPTLGADAEQGQAFPICWFLIDAAKLAFGEKLHCRSRHPVINRGANMRSDPSTTSKKEAGEELADLPRLSVPRSNRRRVSLEERKELSVDSLQARKDYCRMSAMARSSRHSANPRFFFFFFFFFSPHVWICL